MPLTLETFKVKQAIQKAGTGMDADQSGMYTAIGRALDTWAVVEAHLCSIFAVAVTAKEYAPAAAAFSAILSFEAQIDMVHAAMTQSFTSESAALAQWKAIKKKLDKLRPARNKLAHGKVVPVVMKGGAIQWRYLPFYHFFTHKERDDFIRMTKTDIVIINASFMGMVKELHDLGKSIGARQNIKAGKILDR